MRKECTTWPFEMLFIIGLIWNKLGLLKDDDTDYLCLSSIWFKGWFSLYNSTILKALSNPGISLSQKSILLCPKNSWYSNLRGCINSTA